MSRTTRLAGDRRRPAVDAEGLELLRRHAPILRFDAMESLRPTTIDAFVDASIVRDDAVKIPVQGDVLDKLAVEGKATWQLDPLGDARPESTAACSAALLAAYRQSENPAAQGVCYGSVVETARAIFLQYWFFYVDNPCVLPLGRHDGDWELVQVRVRKRDRRATHVTVAQHGGPETQRMAPETPRPVVFVALDSHACYLKRGAQPLLPLSDVCDAGQQPEGDLVVERMPVDGWPLWRGRWGVDRGPGTSIARRLHLPWTPAPLRWINRTVQAGDSPSSPSWQGSWPSPAGFQARGVVHKGTRVALRRFAHWLGRLTWPRTAPTMRIERVAADRVTVVAKAHGHGPRRVRFVAVLLHEAETGRPLALRRVKAHGDEHTIPLPASTTPLAWRAAGYNLLRQRGDASPSHPLDDRAAPEDVEADAAPA